MSSCPCCVWMFGQQHIWTIDVGTAVGLGWGLAGLDHGPSGPWGTTWWCLTQLHLPKSTYIPQQSKSKLIFVVPGGLGPISGLRSWGFSLTSIMDDAALRVRVCFLDVYHPYVNFVSHLCYWCLILCGIFAVVRMAIYRRRRLSFHRKQK